MAIWTDLAAYAVCAIAAPTALMTTAMILTRVPEMRTRIIARPLPPAILAMYVFGAFKVFSAAPSAAWSVASVFGAVVALGPLMQFLLDSRVYSISGHVAARAGAGKVAVVTGANIGIGYEAALGLARTGYTVVLGCRDPAKGKAAEARINADPGVSGAPEGTRGSAVYIHADLASLRSVRAFANEIARRHKEVHVLVNNAGMGPKKGRRTVEGLEEGFGVMHVAHFLLTKLLRPCLEKASRGNAPARVVNVSSCLHVVGKFHESLFEGDGEGDLRGEIVDGKMPSYGRAKLANALFTYELAKRWGTESVVFHTLHPGAVGTNIWKFENRLLLALWLTTMRHVFRFSAEAAEVVLYLALDDECADRTRAPFFANCYAEDTADRSLSVLARDAKLQARLWEVSERLVSDFL